MVSSDHYERIRRADAQYPSGDLRTIFIIVLALAVPL